MPIALGEPSQTPLSSTVASGNLLIRFSEISSIVMGALMDLLIFLSTISAISFSFILPITESKMINATRAYFILEGNGEFIIDDISEKVEQYDLFIVNTDQTYEYKGKMKMIEFNSPATDSSNYERVD